ncbi:MAG: biotin attachment protein, partial [Micrococcales bacterium]
MPSAGSTVDVMLAIVAPGQGAQTPGFLTPWLELPGFAERFEWLSTVAGIDLVTHGTVSDAETIRDTAVAQPLLVATGLVSLLALFPSPADAYAQVSTGAGHSVGEITAAAGAGVISAEAAMVFVRERGNAMARASAARPTGMSAVLGGDPMEVMARLHKLGLTPANVNTAVEVLAKHAAAISTKDPRVALLSNADGTVVHSGTEVLQRLVAQVSKPVRWDRCMQTMTDQGITGLIELPPAGTLVGLAKRGMKGVETLALKSPDDLDKARDMAARHARPTDLSQSPTWRLVVAPAKGVIHLPDRSRTGADIPAGQVVAQVHGGRETYEVS